MFCFAFVVFVNINSSIAYSLLYIIKEYTRSYEECTVLDIRDSGRDFMLVCETESSERFLLKEPTKSLFVAGDSIEIEHLYNKLTKNNKYYYKGKCVLSCKIRKE